MPPLVRSDGNRLELPLCVDLDGTLVKTDCLWESLVALLRQNPLFLLKVPLLLRDRSLLKREVAIRAKLDVSLLPYNEDLLDFLREERANGRHLVLATASSELIARDVAAHLKIFDTVLASDESTNLKGSRKAEALVARFGHGKFDYAGNSSADLKIWQAGAGAIVVDTPRSVVKRIPREVDIQKTFLSTWRFKTFIRSLRPYQWVKNTLVFIPILTAGELGNLDSWITAATMAVAFSFVASALYICNDITDLSADRMHPRKRNRPFASGDVSIPTGLVMAGILLILGFAAGAQAGGTLYLAAYAALSLSYTAFLKLFPLVDVFALGALYSLRLFAGGDVTGHPVSLWLLAYSSFLFLSLALLKRVAELGNTQKSSRGYRAGDRDILQTFGVAATFVSSTLLALYVQSETAVAQQENQQLLWNMVPLLLLWQCRLWLATSRGKMHDDPIVYAAKDWVSRIIVVVLGMVVIASLPR